MNTSQPEVTAEAKSKESIAIVGGGITGLFSAYVLAHEGYSVDLMESSDEFGGRIRSFLLHRDLMDEAENQERESKPHSVKDNAVINELDVVDGRYENLEFCAEFGPMRIELEVQVLLGFLLEHLGILDHGQKGTRTKGDRDSVENIKVRLKAAHLEPFPSFTSPVSDEDPVYQLRPDEENKSPLELMNLALCRAVVHSFIVEDERMQDVDRTKWTQPDTGKPKAYKQKREALIAELRDGAAVQEPPGPIFTRWAKTLREDDYWVIARYGHIKVDAGDESVDVPLYAMGFWNLMSIYLSHNALTKVRDLGTFYHLLPENPNAAHWLTWQLRSLSISSQLQGIYGGMQAIIASLLHKMNYPPSPGLGGGPGVCTVGKGEIRLHLNAHVATIGRPETGSGLGLTFAKGGEHARADYSRVILALPKSPAHEIVMASQVLRDAHNQLEGERYAALPTILDSSFGFPMVKTFFVVRDRWWEETKRTNWFATRFPTREVHYWKSRDPNSRRGMVMLYTDRPASSFWANYVPAGPQNDVEELCLPKPPKPKDGKDATDNQKREEPVDKNRKMIRARLKQRLVQYINDNHVPDITEADIIWCGIMDWGRMPYGAGNHAWRPERPFWQAMADLADITLDKTAGPHIHICGEAFADYTGFIEGSLRSATYALTKILQKAPGEGTEHVVRKILGAIVEDGKLEEAFKDTKPEDPPAKIRKHDYLEDLVSWVDSLDTCRWDHPPTA